MGYFFEAKMCTFTLESTQFIFNKSPIYTHNGARAKFSNNSHETDYSCRETNSFVTACNSFQLTYDVFTFVVTPMFTFFINPFKLLIVHFVTRHKLRTPLTPCMYTRLNLSFREERRKKLFKVLLVNVNARCRTYPTAKEYRSPQSQESMYT
jgi:hypothetical protein